MIERLSERPVVVIIEDVHHCGASTYEWLSFALRRGHALVFVLTTRPDGASLPGADELALGPLGDPAVRMLLGDEAEESLVDAVVARAAGNPLFVLALAAARGARMPATIREAVDRQTDRLGAAAATIRAAAVIGDDIDLDLLAAVTTAPVGDVLEHLEIGCRAGLLAEGATGFEFRHELVREALNESAGITRRALVHRDAARALDRRVPRDALGIAVHARLGGDSGLAADAFVDAARAAFDRFDVDAAFAHVDAALALRPTAGAYSLRARLRLVVLELDEARADAAEAVALGGGSESLEVAAWTAYYRRRYDEARQFADAGAAVATDPGVELSCRAVGGRVRHGEGDLAGAEAYLTAVGRAPVGVRGVADVWLAVLRAHQGRPAEALGLADRALVHPERLTHAWAATHGRFARVFALGQLGRVEQALVACDELELARRRTGEVGARFEGIAANCRGWLLRNVGCFELADDSNERALAAHAEHSRLQASGLTEAYWVAKLDLIDGSLAVGDLDAARRRLADAAGLDAWNGTMAWHQRQRLGLLRARATMLEGDIEDAWAAADRVRADAAMRGSRRYELLAAAVMAVCEPSPDPTRVDDVIDGLESCARLEGWQLASDLARRGDSERWRQAAERMAADVIAHAGPHRAAATAWVERRLSGPSSR